MKAEMLMPQMGESIAEATILKWLKKVGDEVKKDETILEISTDKVDSEIPAPESGTIVELVAQEGDTVPVKSIIAIIETDAAQAAAAPAPKKAKPAAKKPPKPEAPKPAPHAAPPPPPPSPPPAAAPAGGVQVQAGSSEFPSSYADKFYSPLVRSIATQEGISPTELAGIPGTGAHGRITKQDVYAYLQYRGKFPASSNGTNGSAPGAHKAPLAPPPPRLDYGPDGTRVEEFDNMRKKIAEHMTRSKATSAHVYSTCEVDVTPVVKWRNKVKSQFQSREGFKLSLTPPFLEAAVKALVQFPQINASVQGEALVLKRDINLGCAVALGNTGLIVPVIKNADQLTIVGIARALNDLAARARSKQLQPDDIMGGTFTVTNPGVFGNIIGNPIINQPQLAILSLGAIKKRPAVVNGDMIAIRDIVYLTLSYDHRVIDGSLGGQFLKYITTYLENWDVNRELY